jgi:O-methyltransferase
MGGLPAVNNNALDLDQDEPDKGPINILVEGVAYDAFRILVQKRENAELYGHRLQGIRDLARLMQSTVLPELVVSDASLGRMNRLTGTTSLEALYILESLRLTQTVPGDVCEFGVAQGRTSALVASVLLETNSPKYLWLYDSFEGLPKPSLKDVLLHDLYGRGSMANYEGVFAIPEHYLSAELADVGFPTDKVRVVKGWIEQQVLEEHLPDQISFAYLDMDLYQSTKDVLAALIRRMPHGGRVVVDDYGFFSSGVRTAIDEIGSEFPGFFDFHHPFESKFVLLTKVRS